MKRGLLPLALGLLAALPSVAAGDQASITSTPSPIVSTKPFEVKIQTTNFGSDVYCYTWVFLGDQEKQVTDWAGAINDKFKMSGSGGTYTLKVNDIQSFYNLTDDELTKLTKIGFIARTQSGAQTGDVFVEVVQGRKNAYSGGEGTQANPFILKTAKDLTDFAETPMDWASDVYVKLDADITLSTFSGIGSKGSPYKGNFDGNGHFVKGVTVTNNTLGSASGFFNAIDGATVSDLGITDANVSGTTFTGVLVGYMTSGKINRCYTAGTVTASSICAGGLVGENHGEIKDCYSIAKVSNAKDFVAGGLVGKNKGTVTNCYASGAVTAHNYAGGLIGANYGKVNASTSFNPSVTASGNYAGRFGGNDNAKNQNDKALAWQVMPMAQTATHGHHAKDHTYSLLDKETYSSVLGWDFNGTWEWKTENTHKYPVLAGIAGQVDPGHNAFYSTSDVAIIDSEASNLSVYPNPVESILRVTASKNMNDIKVYSLNGSLMNDMSVDGQDAEVDCQGLASGIYILGVQFADGTRAVKKIIKK